MEKTGRELRSRPQPTKKPVISPSKRKREMTTSSRSRRRRSTKNGTAEPLAEGSTVELKQASWSSGLSISDDEELPPAVLNSPAKDSETKQFKKFDIVWIKYKNDVYRPCLITNVYKNHVNFKYINQSRKSSSYRARFHKIIRFDDPDQNYKLLNQGRTTCPAIVDAYDRVKHFLCRLAEQENLSPLKYLFFDKTEDLLYGIVPDLEDQQEATLVKDKDDDNESLLDDDEFERPVVESSENEDDEKGDEEEGDVKNNKSNNQPEEDEDIYKKMSDEEKVQLSEKVQILLKIIETEECFNHLRQIVEESVEGESLRMKFLKEDQELELQFISGLGPFFGAEQSDTDRLSEVLDSYSNRLQFTGDLSLLQRHVLAPEAIIFALQTHCKLERDAAEKFFKKFNSEIPKWEL